MAEFIANRIKKERKKSIEDAKNKYRLYFVKISLYEEFRNSVNEILIKEGFEDVIVTE